jgi:fatty-acyl-CoA synthase
MQVSWQTDWIRNRSRITPDQTAVIEGETGERWSYQDLELRAENLAKYLYQLGIRKGDRVAILAPNHVCYFDYLFACGKLGALLVPLNWRLSVHELTYILNDCEPKILGYHTQWESMAQKLPVPLTIRVNGPEYEEKLQSGTAIGLEQIPESEHEVQGSDPLLIIYTGGTTGNPKGVVLTHDNIWWNAINTVLSWNLNARDITPTFLPMFHTGGLNALSIPVLLIGGTVVLAREFSAEKAIQLINQYHCTIILMVPTMYQMMIQSDRFKDAHFPTVHTFLSGGAPCPLNIYQAFEAKGIYFKEGYGLTEAGPNNFYIDPAKARVKKGSVGTPMMYNRVKLIGINGEENVPPGEVGEILIQGKHVFSHYWNNPEATTEALTDGWLHSGDLGRQDTEGYYYIVGRKKDMIITGGENVYPLEVEHVICSHPEVEEAAVIGLPDEKWGEVVTAVVVPRLGVSLTEEVLKAYCYERLGRYKVPKKIVFTEQLPKTPVGKINKKELVNQYRSYV